MITNLCSQDPFLSQSIDTDLEISAIVLTGNVLLVKGSDTVVAWLLTEEGVVDGIVGNTRADHNDSLWNVSLQAHSNFWARLLQKEDHANVLEFMVEDETAAITHNGDTIHVYNTRTGEILELDRAPICTGYQFDHQRWDGCNLYHRGSHKHYAPLSCDWPVSQTTLQEGWVKDPEGKHRLWLYPHWRSSQNDVDWLYNVTALRLRTSSELIIIKF